MKRALSTRYVACGALAAASGTALVAGESLKWYFTQDSVLGQSAAVAQATAFYSYVALGIAMAVAGTLLIGIGLAKKKVEEPGSVWTVISRALNSRPDIRVGAVAGVLYGIAYLFVSSMVVYQPSVDFAAVYGVTAPSVSAAACCGSPGTVPELIVYLMPQWHFALQILPLDAFFAAVIPILVGFNVAVAAHALRDSGLRSNAGWLAPVGIAAGLFTGCPTCAGLALAGALGGLGATSLAVALAPFQALFIALSIPALVASPFLVSVYAGKAAVAACAVPVSGTAPAGTKNP